MQRHRQVTRRRRDPVKIDLTVDITNFGSITSGRINVKPLTILIGPNNSGKSYAAILLHSIISANSDLVDVSYLARRRFHDLYDMCHSALELAINENEKGKSYTIPINLSNEVRARIIKDIFRDILSYKINRNFGVSTYELIRSKQKLSKITVSDSNILDVEITKDTVVVSVHPDTNDEYKVAPESDRLEDDPFALYSEKKTLEGSQTYSIGI